MAWESIWVVAAVSWRLGVDELISRRIWHHSRSPGAGVGGPHRASFPAAAIAARSLNEPARSRESAVAGDLVSRTPIPSAVSKVLIFSERNSRPATGSLQPVAIEATRGGNETVGAFETDGSLWRLGEPTGRNSQ